MDTTIKVILGLWFLLFVAVGWALWNFRHSKEPWVSPALKVLFAMVIFCLLFMLLEHGAIRI